MKHTFSLIRFSVYLLVVLGALAVAGCSDDGDDPGIDCTADAIMCSDGTFVGRSGPDCTFDCSAHGGIAELRFFTEERTYVYEPEACTGTPENPNCTETLFFFADGRADKTFDDIVETGTYEIWGTQLTVQVSTFTATFTLANDETELVSGDTIYVLSE